MGTGSKRYRQGYALRRITRSPKVPYYEIQGAQHKVYKKEIRLSGCPKAKVSRLRHLGALRAQPWVQEAVGLDPPVLLPPTIMLFGIVDGQRLLQSVFKFMFVGMEGGGGGGLEVLKWVCSFNVHSSKL